MSIEKVNAALVSGYLALPFDIPTYYETRDDAIGTASPENHWASVMNMPSTDGRAPLTLGAFGYDEQVGVFSMTFHVPENTGTQALHRYADAVCNYFVAGQRITYLGQEVQVMRASPSSIRKVDGTYAITASVYWRALVMRGAVSSGGTTIPGGNTGGGGGTSGVAFEFVQATPALSWTINHNLGRKVEVEVFDTGGRKIIADVQNVNANQTIVTFLTPQAGYALID